VKSKLFLLIPFWAAAVGGGLHSLMVYKGKAGSFGETPGSWATNAVVTLIGDKPNLVMFAHPQCPCTKASLAELELLAAKAKNRFHATVVFYEPTDTRDMTRTSLGRFEPSTWTNTPLVRLARSIPGVLVAFDRDAALAKRFGAETSGHTVVYSSDGRLLFSGGITGSRGHSGFNAGYETVLNILNGAPAQLSKGTAPVFGCDLFNPCTPSQTAKRN
jgi:hypothetical protein